MRSRELRSHLGLFCSRTATVQDLVSCAEAYRAARTEADLISDDEGVAVTVAYSQGRKSGVLYKQWHKTAADKKPEASTSATVARASIVPSRPKPLGGYRQKVPTGRCSVKCFHCGKEGHFMRDCDKKGSCFYISKESLACEDRDNERCECECGQHRHFLNADCRDGNARDCTTQS